MEIPVSSQLAESAVALRPTRVARTLPDPARMIVALRQIGYSFEQAIADLIDNCINARAKAVLVRFVTRGDRIRSIVIADDGTGMSEPQIAEAMRFGSDRDLAPHSLGKYGMGLKLASLSYARCLTVISSRGRATNGRRWTIKGIERGWDCEVLAKEDVVRQANSPWGPIDLRKSGTLVIWDELDKLATSATGLRSTLRSLAKRLETHLGLCFHRFLEARELSIFLDQQTEGLSQHSIRVEVAPLNPFAYPVSGKRGYPKIFRTVIPNGGPLNLEAHVWPANSDLPQYKLGNKAASRQGFYFYRNGRLIQAGGWNGLVQQEAEQHSSLARIVIDLPTRLDAAFGLNVQKSAVIVPTGFDQAVLRAEADDGDTFDAYRRAAQQLYRHKDNKAEKSLPLVPGKGLPRQVTRVAKARLFPAAIRTREVVFEWIKLPNTELFKLDRKRRVICLNSDYRHCLLTAQRIGRTDLPVLKILLFLLTSKHFDNDRISSRQKERLDIANCLLTCAAAKKKVTDK